eukprot:3155778-Pyramimonas_sp.AAC.2
MEASPRPPSGRGMPRPNGTGGREVGAERRRQRTQGCRRGTFSACMIIHALNVPLETWGKDGADHIIAGGSASINSER